MRGWLKPRIAKLRYKVIARGFESAGRGGSLGRGLNIPGNLTVNLGERVAIREGCWFGGRGTLSIGDRTAINAGCILTAMERIEIGSDVMMAPGVYVLDVDHAFPDRTQPISRQGYEIAPVHIGNGAWIGAGAVITRGVTIGEGAIVGANSVVTRDVAPLTIIGGIPAKVIKERPE